MRAGRASDGAATGAVSRRLGLDLGRSGGYLPAIKIACRGVGEGVPGDGQRVRSEPVIPACHGNLDLHLPGHG